MKELTANRPGTVRKASRWVRAAFAAILVLYIFSALQVNPIATFGTSADDAAQLSSARALAQRKGYVLPEFPCGLRATKYPQLYPWLLFGV